MSSVYGGEIFGRDNSIPSPYQVYRDQQSLVLQEKRIKAQEKREQNARDAKMGAAIKTTFDTNHRTTGTPVDPVINERLKGLMEKYSQLYIDSKGSLDVSDLTLAMNRDLMDVKAYYDNVNVIKANAMKSAEASVKQGRGFNKQELYQLALDRALYKDGKVIQDLEDFDLQKDFVNDVIDYDYNKLHISNEGMYDDLKKLPTETRDREIVTRDKHGFETKYRGSATWNDRFQEVSYNKETGEPEITLKTIPVTTPDGSVYKDKLTGNEVKTIDEDTYQELIANRQLGARINQIADGKLAELKAKNIPVDDADLQILRRAAATEQLDGVFRGKKTKFLSVAKNRVPSGRYKVGRADEPLPFNLEAAPVDKNENIDLTGQVGGFVITDPSNKSGHTLAEVLYTKNNGLLLRTYDRDAYNNKVKQRPDMLFYGKDARNIIEANVGWPGNNRKDLYKLRDLFQDAEDYDPMSGIPKVNWKDPLAPSVKNTDYKQDKKPSSNNKTSQQKPSNNSSKKKISW